MNKFNLIKNIQKYPSDWEFHCINTCILYFENRSIELTGFNIYNYLINDINVFGNETSCTFFTNANSFIFSIPGCTQDRDNAGCSSNILGFSCNPTLLT